MTCSLKGGVVPTSSRGYLDTDAQKRYTVIEKELLSIVETIKVLRTILLNQILIIYTDHKTFTYRNFKIDRVLRWRLIFEEYGTKI